MAENEFCLYVCRVQAGCRYQEILKFSVYEMYVRGLKLDPVCKIYISVPGKYENATAGMTLTWKSHTPYTCVCKLRSSSAYPCTCCVTPVLLWSKSSLTLSGFFMSRRVLIKVYCQTKVGVVSVVFFPTLFGINKSWVIYISGVLYAHTGI